ncbi:MAG: hypothetical protein QGI45_10165 [Myxococcota bacterium]|jgi:hypothetical protein|nr:hypothetical protein [Myxococcota bacterium]
MQEPNDLQELEELRGVDLAMIDLAALDLDKPPTNTRWVGVLARILVLLAFGFLVWLPQSEYFRFHQNNNGLFFSVCIGAIILGATLGRWLWMWLEERAKKAPLTRQTKSKEPRIPHIAVRILMLLAAAGIMIWILFILPNQGSFNRGHGYSQNWFMALGGAGLVALLLSRWLVYQAQRPVKKPKKPIRIVLPPWFKWLTLIVIIGLALFAAFGAQLFTNSGSMEVEFGLGATALIVGISAALWIAGRFDEAEARFKAQARKKIP